MSDEEVCTVTCPTCGIDFSFSKKIEKLWRDTHKSFFCPNQHSMSWTGKVPDPNEKELKKLRNEVKELTEQLASMTLKVTEASAKVEELTAELEIWRPTDKT
jgi:peptidoglycan hydrolase CwlO-like protein